MAHNVGYLINNNNNNNNIRSALTPEQFCSVLFIVLGMRQKYTKLNQACSINMFNKSSKKKLESRE